MDQSPTAAAQRLVFNKQALISAVSTGDTETVVHLSDGDVPVHTNDNERRSLFHLAALGGLATAMKLLIKEGYSRGGTTKSEVAGNYGMPAQQAAFTVLMEMFEHCFIYGPARILSQFCEASGIRTSGEGLRGALTTLITLDLVDAHKVLCLCAICGDSVFLNDMFIDLVASDACAMPAALKCVKYYFCKGEGVQFLNQLRIPDENTLNPLHISLLSLKCYEMGFAIDLVETAIKDHTSFITKLLSHPVLKEIVHENFPNGLSPLDLARQFELRHIAALIEKAGGRLGVWAGVPREIEVRYPLALLGVKEVYASFKAIGEDGEHVRVFIRHLLSHVLSESSSNSPPLHGAGQNSKDGILREKPTMSGHAHLNLARQSELHHIAALIEGAEGHAGVGADIPRDVYARVRSKLLRTCSSLMEMCDPSQGGHESVRSTVIKLLNYNRQTVEMSTPSLGYPNTMIVSANVGAKTDELEYKSLSLVNSVDDVSDLIVKCNIDINAMLNHSEGGIIHFGIDDSGRVEMGLHIEQNLVITKLREKIGQMLNKYRHRVESPFVQVKPVNLWNYKQEPTDQWRFDIVVKPHATVVQLARKETGYYRHGATSVHMTCGEFVRKIRAEPKWQRGPKEATIVDGSVSSWDENAAATVGANVGAERHDHEYKSLMGPVGGGRQPSSNVRGIVRRVGDKECRRAINAMLNHPTGGCIHYGIYDNGIVQEGLDLEQNHCIDELRKKVGDVQGEFWPPVEFPYVEVEPVNLRNDKQALTGRWRFDIVVKPHPTVVLLTEDGPAYCRRGTQCHKMVPHELADKVRHEPAGQLPYGY